MAGVNVALVESGDPVSIDVPGSPITLDVPDEKLVRRRVEQERRELPYSPVDRVRPVSAALRAYASMTTSAT